MSNPANEAREVKVLAVVSPKGGVGKTTLALNVAWALARRLGGAVLVDADPQGGVGHSVAAAGGGGARPGLFEVHRGQVSLTRALVCEGVEPLDLLTCGHPPEAALDDWVAALSWGEVTGELFRRLAVRYPLIVVDTPSGLTGPTRGVLRHATHVLVPVQAEPLALRSAPQLLSRFAELGAGRGRLELAGFVPTMVRSRNEVSLAATQELFRLLPRQAVLESFVPWDPAFLEASARGVPAALLPGGRPAVAAVFETMADELLPRLGLGEETTPRGGEA